MDNIKNDNYYVGKIVENLDFIVQHMKGVDKDELNDNEVLLDSIENIVAQTLAANGHELYYHTFLNEKTRHNYEVDFLISEKNKISAIEVKSSGYKTHPSIGAFSL